MWDTGAVGIDTVFKKFTNLWEQTDRQSGVEG